MTHRLGSGGIDFPNRLAAGEALAARLEAYRGTDAVVAGLARGGVEVGFALARELQLPLRALVVRKLGAPGNPELAIGAVSETGVRWIDEHIVRLTGATPEYIQQEIETQVAEAQRRKREYAVSPGLETVQGRPAIVADDGIATGASALVAVQSVRDLGATEVVLATPAASPQAVQVLEPHVDELVALLTPDPFIAVGMYYRDFRQVDDEDVLGYLRAGTTR